MGHYSTLHIGRAQVFWVRDGYDSDLVALFTEADRRHEDEEYGYRSTAAQMRDRLQLHGFTAMHARRELDSAVDEWRKEVDSGDPVPPNSDELIETYRKLLDVPKNDFDLPAWGSYLEIQEPSDIFFHLDIRALLRLLLDMTPDSTEVVLDLSQLIGCCVELGPAERIATQARTDQRANLSADAPLIVLTEGTTDSELLSLALEVTHPHLIGMVNFLDFGERSRPEGGVGALRNTAKAFVAASVANRFIALADNDAAAHEGLADLKSSPDLPATCRIVHYPDLELLQDYPTLGPYSAETVRANVNGSAGSLEMYLGVDVLTKAGELVPVQWTSYKPKVHRYQGSLLDPDKRRVQEAFREKVRDARLKGPDGMDWTGVRAIIEAIIHAFD
ncbi:hypothetical protein DMH03_25570 [Amycolatopsis sp. WAC 01376]|uniref:HEPN/Toprim-associated domain-containing protein n=1 Tax=Amycolatopsis sp. WAC 01376 TaxID=2203195 RepID=UPI000F79A04F|nr:HEPN/Toprim-associated domain-containing protein [Amycolatopsis sp. WAC 01376]RSM59230.1 hypothetical protein DMH03_25570 [Amycolatopsis sp. WAC 01376]